MHRKLFSAVVVAIRDWNNALLIHVFFSIGRDNMPYSLLPSLPRSPQSLPCLPGLWKQPAAGGGDNGSYLSIRGREDMAMACLAQGEALGAAMDGTGPLMQSRSDTWRDGPYYYLQPLPGSDDWPVER